MFYNNFKKLSHYGNIEYFKYQHNLSLKLYDNAYVAIMSILSAMYDYCMMGLL